MAGRTFAIGDVHGDRAQLEVLLGRLPPLDAKDTIVFVGDYVDRGPQSAQVVIGIDTRCGHGGFLTAVELPGLAVYESRSGRAAR
jgi:hypothetical protein